MSTLVVIATADTVLAETWERQVPDTKLVVRFEMHKFPTAVGVGTAAIVVLDAALETKLPRVLVECPTIYVGEPKTLPFEQARIQNRARVYLSYEESATRLNDFIPLLADVAEKRSLIEMMTERARRIEAVRNADRVSSSDNNELWDFLEGAIENLDTRERLISEFRRASRLLLHASHAVFFLRETDGFRADKGTSYFSSDDPLVRFFENHPVVVDGKRWDSWAEPVAELAVRNRLALWGARLLVPVHDNGRLLGLIALGVKDDGQEYDEGDRVRAVLFAKLFRQFVAKNSQLDRLNSIAAQSVIGAKYLPGTLVLGPNEEAPRHVPLVVREIVSRARKFREIVRAAPTESQPFRASAGIVAETGGVWAFWEEASVEVDDSIRRERFNRSEILREIGLTLNHELGNALVSLATFRQTSSDRPLPAPLLEGMRRDVMQLEKLNDNLVLMNGLYEVSATEIDVRDVVREVANELGVPADTGVEPVVLSAKRKLLDYALRSFVCTLAENRLDYHFRGLSLKLRGTGIGDETTALVSIRGKDLELEGILPELPEGSVPNLGRLGVFLAKEILRLHHGEVHAGPGMEGTEILISFRRL